MPTISEEQLAQWTKRAFDNEDERRKFTERAICDAINADTKMTNLPINVYGKGSFKNNTNVRKDSDVDVAVEYTGVVYPEYAEGVSAERLGLEPYDESVYPTASYKDDLERVLKKAFGAAVTRRNKVFRISESSKWLAADVVPCFTHRWYYGSGPGDFKQGTQLIADKPGRAIHNFPEQHYDNGCRKNNATSRRFKRVVRILKNLENRMVSDGAHPIVASYLIESLVYNVPNTNFGRGSWAADVRGVLAQIWEDTENVESEKRWLEVNGIKYLFHDATQRWTRNDARNFVYAAWQYVHQS